MLVLFFSLLLPMLNVAAGLERRSLAQSLPNGKRGFITTGHNFPHGYEFRQLQPIVTNPRNLRNEKHLPYGDLKFVPRESPLITSGEPPAYNDAFKKSPSYANLPVVVRSAQSLGNEQASIHPENLFTMSATYKVDGDGNSKPFKQAAGNIQVPVYRASYPVSKASESQIYAPVYQNKNSPLILQAQRGQEVPTYWSSVQNQPLVSNPAGHRFDFGARPPNANNVQSSSSSSSPRSRFQGQVVPIPTATNSHQFARYKGAFVQVHPTIGAASTVAYQPLQAQPQLHFDHVHAQHVQRADDPRHSTPSQEIRSDVELIDEKRPVPPPKRGDDEDDDNGDDQGYGYHRTRYGVNSQVDPRKYFQAPSTESTFKPSASFPFKQYDETFGKYSNQNHDTNQNQNQNQIHNQDGKAPEKALAKFHSYATSTVNDKDDEDTPFEKYHADDTLPKSYQDKQEANREEGGEDDREDEAEGDDEDDGDGGHGYERQRTEESSDNGQGSRYLDKDFDEEFERSYRTEAPKQRYVHVKETPEVQYGVKPTRRNKNDYKSEDPSRHRSRTSSNYRTLSEDTEDTEGHSSDILTSLLLPHTIHDEIFGYKIPQKRF